MARLLSDLQGHALAWAFLRPVNKEDVVDYYDVIKKPMGECFPFWIILPMFTHPALYRISLYIARRLLNNGDETRQQSLPDLQRLCGRRDAGVRELQEVQPGELRVCEKRDQDGEVR